MFVKNFESIFKFRISYPFFRRRDPQNRIFYFSKEIIAKNNIENPKIEKSKRENFRLGRIEYSQKKSSARIILPKIRKPRNQALSKGTIPTSFLVWILSRSNRIYFPCLPRLSPRENPVDEQKHKQKPLENERIFQISISRRHTVLVSGSIHFSFSPTRNMQFFLNFLGRKGNKNASINFSTRPPTILRDKLVAKSGRKINERDKWTHSRFPVTTPHSHE